MRKLAVASIVIWLIVLSGTIARTSSIAQWNHWVNQVQIAGLPGSNEEFVRQFLGKPEYIAATDSIEPGFSPHPAIVPSAERVYVYIRMFLWPPWYWAAYVFVDESGQVVQVHIGKS